MASSFKKFLIVLCGALLLAAPSFAYERIVSLYAGHTDNIIALGGQNKLVGLSKNDEPARLPELPRFAPKTGAEAILAVQRATAEGIRLINEAAPTDAMIKLRSLEAFQAAANGHATKIIIPSEIQNMAGLVESIKEIATDKDIQAADAPDAEA